MAGETRSFFYLKISEYSLDFHQIYGIMLVRKQKKHSKHTERRDNMKQKMYPFSARKHAHDIELVANRSYNLAHEARERRDMDEEDRLWKIHEEANEVLLAIQEGMQGWSGITMLSGQMIGKAKQMVVAAAEIRDGLNMQYR